MSVAARHSSNCPICVGGRVELIGSCSVCGEPQLHRLVNGALVCGACGFDTRPSLAGRLRTFDCPQCGRNNLMGSCACRICLYCDFAERCS